MEKFKQFITENNADYEIGEYYKIYPVEAPFLQSYAKPLYHYQIGASTWSRNPTSHSLHFIKDYWFVKKEFYFIVKVKQIFQEYLNSITLEGDIINASSFTNNDIKISQKNPIKTNLQDHIHDLPIRIFEVEKHRHEKIEEGDPDFFKTVEDSF